MNNQHSENPRSHISAQVSSLMSLTRFKGDSKEFWRLYVRQFSTLCGAEQAMLVGQGREQWFVLHTWILPEREWLFDAVLGQIASETLKQGIMRVSVADRDILSICIDVGPQEESPVLLMDLKQNAKVLDQQSLYFGAGIPSTFQLMRQYGKAREDVVYFAEILKLLGSLQDDRKFKLAAMRLCNEVVALFQCEQVSLGWADHAKQIKVCAISNLETFDQRTHAIWELEAAMEECLDQDAEIIWRKDQDHNILVRAHKAYASVRSVGHLISLPLRLGEDKVGVLTLESANRDFGEEDAWRLRLLLEQCAHRLSVLEYQDRWVGEKLRRKSRQFFTSVFRVEKVGLFAIGFVMIVLVAILTFGYWPYKVDGTFALKAEHTVHISAPVDGIVEEAPVRPGDVVKKGDMLMGLNTRDLLLERAKTLARIAQHQHEAEKARATYSLAEMRIAQSAAEEANIELQQIDFRLENAVVKSPFDGVVVEGELQAKIGVPLRQGETFMKVSSLDGLYVEILIAEQDIHDVNIGDEASISFVGRPDLAYQVRLEQIIPQAQVNGGQNMFVVRAEILTDMSDWWRPGMSGVAKINVGERSIWWMLTHQTFDFLRLKFWL